MSKTNNKPNMNKKIKKIVILVCLVMIFIHILGLVYQILSNSTTLSILLKELFIIIFISQIILIKFEIKYAKYICYGLNLAIIVISGFYMDFSSVIISILLMLYISNLYSDFAYIDDTKNNVKINKRTTKKTTNQFYKSNVKRDVK